MKVLERGAYAKDFAGWSKAIEAAFSSVSISRRYVTGAEKKTISAEASVRKHSSAYVVASWTPEGGHKPGNKATILVATADVNYHAAERGLFAQRRMRHQLARWMTTQPHPTRPAHTDGYDQGQTGWKLHVIYGPEKKLFDRPYAKALCGLRPANGWGLDLYIDDLCTRCLAAAVKRGLTLPAPPR